MQYIFKLYLGLNKSNCCTIKIFFSVLFEPISTFHITVNLTYFCAFVGFYKCIYFLHFNYSCYIVITSFIYLFMQSSICFFKYHELLCLAKFDFYGFT